MPRTDPWVEAVTHLRIADERWHAIIDRVGPCALRPRKDRFGTLVRAILGQQISAKAAASIDRKVRERAGDPHTPEGLLALSAEELRGLGVSGVKARYLHALAEATASGALPLTRIGRWSDEQIITQLTELPGIGRWTAEMFLIFALNRPDVLPVADFGIKAGLRDFFGLEEAPRPTQCIDLAAPWRPYRSVAMWYLWRRLDSPRTP